MSVVVEELLQHVQHAGHLGEDENAMLALLQPTQQGVERLQLTYTHTHTPKCYHSKAHTVSPHFKNTSRLQLKDTLLWRTERDPDPVTLETDCVRIIAEVTALPLKCLFMSWPLQTHSQTD